MSRDSAAAFAGSAWRTEGCGGALVVYELHAARFTDVHKDAAGEAVAGSRSSGPRGACRPGGIISRTCPYRQLEFLPIHDEFPSDNSWGYNPALFFGAQNPPSAAQTPWRRAYASRMMPARPMLLDLVYNHLSDSPLTLVAPEVSHRRADAMGPDDHLRSFRLHGVLPPGHAFYMWDAFSIDGLSLRQHRDDR